MLLCINDSAGLAHGETGEALQDGMTLEDYGIESDITLDGIWSFKDQTHNPQLVKGLAHTDERHQVCSSKLTVAFQTRSCILNTYHLRAICLVELRTARTPSTAAGAPPTNLFQSTI